MLDLKSNVVKRGDTYMDVIKSMLLWLKDFFKKESTTLTVEVKAVDSEVLINIHKD